MQAELLQPQQATFAPFMQQQINKCGGMMLTEQQRKSLDGLELVFKRSLKFLLVLYCLTLAVDIAGCVPSNQKNCYYTYNNRYYCEEYLSYMGLLDMLPGACIIFVFGWFLLLGLYGIKQKKLSLIIGYMVMMSLMIAGFAAIIILESIILSFFSEMGALRFTSLLLNVACIGFTIWSLVLAGRIENIMQSGHSSQIIAVIPMMGYPSTGPQAAPQPFYIQGNQPNVVYMQQAGPVMYTHTPGQFQMYPPPTSQQQQVMIAQQSQQITQYPGISTPQ